MMRHLIHDLRATSAVEFAICLPFLITLYFGSYQICDGISAYRKVTTATKSIADLASQYATVTDGDLDSILNAAQQIMSPYQLSNAKLTITQVKIDPTSGDATVDWSRGLNVNPLVKGSAFTVPTSIKVKGTYLIVGSINYTYQPTAGRSIIGTIPMHDQIILSPRVSPSISCVQPTCTA